MYFWKLQWLMTRFKSSFRWFQGLFRRLKWSPKRFCVWLQGSFMEVLYKVGVVSDEFFRGSKSHLGVVLEV